MPGTSSASFIMIWGPNDNTIFNCILKSGTNLARMLLKLQVQLLSTVLRAPGDKKKQ